MSELNGFIKLWRCLINNPIWQEKPYSKGQAFVDLLMKANHKDNIAILGNKEMLVKRGQHHTSELKLSKEWGWSRNKCRAYLKQLERLKMLTTNSTPYGTTITIENYEIYQGSATTLSTTNETEEGTTQGQRKDSARNTNKNVKNDKNVKKERMKEIYKEIPTELHEPLDAFIEMRKLKKKPLNTDRALTMLLKKLNELSDGDIQTSIDILDQSTTNCWTGIFPLKEKDKPKTDSVSFLDL